MCHLCLHSFKHHSADAVDIHSSILERKRKRRASFAHSPPVTSWIPSFTLCVIGQFTREIETNSHSHSFFFIWNFKLQNIQNTNMRLVVTPYKRHKMDFLWNFADEIVFPVRRILLFFLMLEILHPRERMPENTKKNIRINVKFTANWLFNNNSRIIFLIFTWLNLNVLKVNQMDAFMYQEFQ